MNAKVIRTMFWTGLLVLLLGESSPRLMAEGPGIPPTVPGIPPTPGGPGIPPTGPDKPPTGGPQGAISVVS
jgi:hypothetical protein